MRDAPLGMEYDTIKAIVLTILGSVSIVGLLGFLGRQLIIGIVNGILAQRLEALRSENAKALEGVRAEYSRSLEATKHDLQWLADRGTRSNEREFQAVSDAWHAFFEADLETRTAVSRFVQYPDLTDLNADTLSKTLETLEVSDSFKTAILEAENRKRNDIYSQFAQSRQVNAAQSAIGNAQSIVRKQSVFMPPALFQLFEDCLAPVRAAWAESSTALQLRGMRGVTIPHEAGVALISEAGVANLERLRLAVRERLLRVDAPPPRSIASTPVPSGKTPRASRLNL